MFGEQTFAQLRTGLTLLFSVTVADGLFGLWGSEADKLFVLLYVYRNHKAYQGRRYEGRRRLYTQRYNVTARMTPALRWAVMRAI